MEYPMATLLKDPGGWTHEWMHSWYQGMLGTNEQAYPWMDEGLTQYAAARIWGYMHKDTSVDQTFGSEYRGYYALTKSGLAEPLSTGADFFSTNFAYSISSYSKGAVFMEQLGYIIGNRQLDKTLLSYYRQWRFKHPNAADFMRVAEEESGMKLDWYKNFWIDGTKTIDYGIDSLWEVAGKTRVRLKMVGRMPMPLDVQFQFRDGKKLIAYIPQYSMFGGKPSEDETISRQECEPWHWTSPTYEFEIPQKLTDLKAIEIDPTHRMADVNRTNNKLELTW
jgi:hypothetical protein